MNALWYASNAYDHLSKKKWLTNSSKDKQFYCIDINDGRQQKTNENLKKKSTAKMIYVCVQEQ